MSRGYCTLHQFAEPQMTSTVIRLFWQTCKIQNYNGEQKTIEFEQDNRTYKTP